MAILKACEIWFPKLDPKRPNSKYNKKNPTWDVQVRTKDVKVKKSWEALGLKPKPVLDEETAELLYFRINLRRRTIKASGEKSDPVDVVNGRLEAIDPRTLGNGSIANIRIFQYKFTNDGEEGLATVLMALQVTKHIKYEPTESEDGFDMQEMDEDDEAFEEGSKGESSSSADDDSLSNPAPKVDDEY
jgi:hypothetical protein